jgi:predicted glycoside hydrolase/deacetylase ChbG (UPF0249 family)
MTPRELTYHITCDDCGMHESINEATLALHRDGMAHSASVMANFPATQHALDQFKPYLALRIGAHLNLSEGQALTGVSLLTDVHGNFLPIGYTTRAWIYASAEYLEAVEAEFCAQIERLAQAGIELEHLTTHMHFHVIPVLREIVLRLARRWNVQWVRAYRARDTMIPNNPWRTLTHAQEDMVLDYLAPVMYWVGHSPHAMREALHAARGTVEIVVHPALPNVPLPLWRYGTEGRVGEVEYLKQVWALLNV